MKLSEPASIVRLEGVPYPIKAEAGGGARRRYHGGRRQFCGRLRGRAPRGRGSDRGRPRGASSRRRCGMPSRRDHPARGDAARAHPEPRQFSQGIAMTAATRQEQLAAIFKSATVIPVLTIERLEDAVPLARALVAGGVRVLEVTLRTPVAVEAAKAMIAEVPEAIVGIGTILNADDLARAAGARRQIRHQPRRDAGAVEGRRRERPAVCAGDRDGFRTDAGAGGRLRSRQILSRPSSPAVSRHCGRWRGRFRISGCARPAASGRPMRRPGWPSRMWWRWAVPGSARRPISGPATGPA